MTSARSRSATSEARAHASFEPWRPEGFEGYRALFSATPALALPDLAVTRAFIARWHAIAHDPIGALRATVREPFSVVLVRGYLGRYMAGNFVSALRAVRAAGLTAFIADGRTGGTVAENARLISRQLDRHLEHPAHQRHRLIFAGHSKGGLEALRVLTDRPDLAARTHTVVMSQTPRGPSRVLESVLLGRHAGSLGSRRRWAERAQRLGLFALFARRGGLDLTRPRLDDVLASIAQAARPFRVLQTASWSSRPTTWLDSFHERLSEIHPGWAHDGQFYLQDLLWPGVDHVLLPHLDHAQPVMDGFGFDSARYWVTALALALDSESA